jgi:hypothetical protein
MKKAIVALALLLSSTDCFGAYGFFSINGSFAVVNSNGGGNTYYHMSNGVGTAFNGTNLGTYNPGLGQTLVLAGGEIQTFQNGGDNVMNGFFAYRIFSGAPSGAFTEISLSNLTILGGGDVRRDNVGANVNVLAGLVNGTYSLQVFSRSDVDWNPTDGIANDFIFANNGGSNYTATFTVVPEPSRVLLLGAGLLGLLMRRRRQ